MKLNKHIQMLLKLCISLALLVFIIRSIDLQKTYHLFLSVNVWLALLAFGLTVLGVGLSSFKLKVLAGEHALTQYVKLNFVGMFFNIFLPGVTGGDVARVAYLKKNSMTTSKSVALVFLDRSSGLFALVILALVGVGILLSQGKSIPLSIASDDVWYFVLVCFALLVIGGVAYRVSEKIRFLVVQSSRELLNFSKNRKALVQTMGISTVFQLLSPLMFFITVKSVDISADIDLVYSMIAIPVVSIAIMLPVTIQGVGLREFLYLQLFPTINSETLVTASLISYIVYLLCGLIGLYFLIFSKHKPVIVSS